MNSLISVTSAASGDVGNILGSAASDGMYSSSANKHLHRPRPNGMLPICSWGYSESAAFATDSTLNGRDFQLLGDALGRPAPRLKGCWTGPDACEADMLRAEEVHTKC